MIPLGIALASAQQPLPASFDLDKDRQPMVQLDGLWHFHPGDDPRWADPAFDDSTWPLIRSDKSWSEQGYKNMSGYAWYRARVLVAFIFDSQLATENWSSLHLSHIEWTENANQRICIKRKQHLHAKRAI